LSRLRGPPKIHHFVSRIRSKKRFQKPVSRSDFKNVSKTGFKVVLNSVIFILRIKCLDGREDALRGVIS
jgi:hypothetical protein